MLAFIRHNFRWIAGGFTLTYFSSFGQTYFISASVSEWQAAFGLSHGEFGRLYMFATLASALCLPIVGRLVDLVPPHRMIAVVAFILAGAALLAGYASSLPVLVIAVFLLRLFGQGMMTHIALTTTGRWFVAERGRAVSLVVLGHQGGEATIPLAFAALTIAYGYRAGWIAAAVALLVIGLPFAYWCYRRPRVPHGQLSTEKRTSPDVRSWTREEVLRDPIFWVLLTGVLAPAFIGTTIFYHQNYLTELNNWPPQLFASSLLVMALTTVGFALLVGAAVDRFGATSVLPYFLLPLSAACFALAYSGPEFTLFIVMVLLGISYGISSTLFGSLWPEIYGLANLGAVRSVTVAAAVLATAAGPGLTGTLIDRGVGLPAQMIFFGLYCLLAAGGMTIASVSLRRRFRISAQTDKG
ncbi:MAG: MFS transporter [Woeseiaceae bacterium]|nr:MFS transporter [Woeseiaceae bacterium]MDX2608276.1 MFS transporter [Woeseiaceae bacterium]